MVISRLFRSIALMLFTIVLLGGCQSVNKSENDGQMQEAKNLAIQYFKDEYGLDVEITDQEKLDEYITPKITMKGHVKGKPEESFNIAVDYEDKKTTNFVMSPELEKAIRAKGIDPFAKKDASN
ncbi:hypothetical protein CM49_03697 [Paenibacillus sp. P1XP2]|nr:hypothetical protein CM49_03697 [Paenibacillus sp. P1XP2]